MKLSIAEILLKASKLSNKEDIINYLRQNYSSAFGDILKYTYDLRYVWDLPNGSPKFVKSKFDESMLYNEVKKMYLFFRGGNPNLTQIKRETLFINFLEKISPIESDLILYIKDNRKLPYENLTFELMNECFPGLFDENVVKQNVNNEYKEEVNEVIIENAIKSVKRDVGIFKDKKTPKPANRSPNRNNFRGKKGKLI